MARRLNRPVFDLWLRTGRVALGPIERKFNGWHDTDDGKFTNVGGGRYFPPGSRAVLRSDRFAMASPPRNDEKSRGFMGGGASGHGYENREEQEAREQLARGRAGNANTSSQRALALHQQPSKYVVRKGDTLLAIARREGMAVPQLAVANDIAVPDQIEAGAKLVIPAKVASGRVVVQVRALRYEIDTSGRTRFVEATLGDLTERRSRREQAQAGIPDRRDTDDGGHFIAPRFGGPKDAFNHFAQDANFNRGAYRVMENDWAKARKDGRDVRVTIDIAYPPSSKRPSKLVVKWTIAGNRKKRTFENEKGGSNDVGN